MKSKIYFTLVMTKLIFPAVLLCLLVVGCGSPARIKYEVTGTAPSVNITMRNSQGGTDQLNNVSLPWTKEFTEREKYTRDSNYDYTSYNSLTESYSENTGCSYQAYISAQNNDYLGNVIVKIYRGNELQQSATSVGAPATATASIKIGYTGYYGRCD